MVSTYLSYRLYTQDLSRSLQRTAAEPQVASDAKYYEANIGKVKSVDDFLSNYRLFNYAMKAYGLEDMAYAKAFMKKVLTSDLTDSSSFANKLADTRYREFAAAFKFGTDGSVANAADIQADDQEGEMAQLYTQRQADAVNVTAAETTYYKNNIDAVTSVDDLMGDYRLYSFALKSVGLDPQTASRTAIRNVLTSDLTDPASIANSFGGDYLELAKSFGFATDGSLTGATAQSAAQKWSTVFDYGNRADAGLNDTQTKLRTLYFQNHIDSVTSVDGLLKDDQLYTYILTAYDIDPSEVTPAVIKKVLESDLSDSTSYANRSGDERFQKLAGAFNIAEDGSITTRRLAQSVESAIKTVAAYNDTVADNTVAKNAAEKETDYYTDTIGELTSLDQLLDDKRLTAYVLKAYGLSDEKLTKAALRKILTSDLADTKSYANRAGDTRYRELAAAFNFDTDGTIMRDAARSAQGKKAALSTTDLYVRQTMEGEAGDQNEGVRLALYFARKAPTISSVYNILGDKALIEVVRTALGLSDTTAQADIDIQAAMIEKRLDIADLQDPKKLEKFLVRFSAMYDIANASSTSSVTSILFGNGTSTSGLSESLIGSFQNIKIGGR